MAGSADAAPSSVSEAAYLLQVAKDWTISTFAAAQGSEFALAPHRFELDGTSVRRSPLRPESPEAVSPLEADAPSPNPVAWSHRALVTVLVDHDAETSAVDQEVAEVIAVDGAVVLAQAAPVVRVSGLGVCLGRFGTPE